PYSRGSCGGGSGPVDRSCSWLMTCLDRPRLAALATCSTGAGLCLLSARGFVHHIREQCPTFRRPEAQPPPLRCLTARSCLLVVPDPPLRPGLAWTCQMGLRGLRV